MKKTIAFLGIAKAQQKSIFGDRVIYPPIDVEVYSRKTRWYFLSKKINKYIGIGKVMEEKEMNYTTAKLMGPRNERFPLIEEAEEVRFLLGKITFFIEGGYLYSDGNILKIDKNKSIIEWGADCYIITILDV